MHHKIVFRRVFVFAMLLTIGGLVFIALGQAKLGVVTGYPAPHSSVGHLPAQPQPDLAYPPPGSSRVGFTSSPLVPPQPPSPAAQIATAHIANRESIPVAVLTVAAEYPVEYRNLERQFHMVTLLDTRPESFKVYKLLIDLADGRVEENVYALRDAEAQAYQARYGKLTPTLYTRLQALDDDDELPVAVWTAAGLGQTMTEQQTVAYATLATRYPEALAALEHSGTPIDVEYPELAQRIREEYHSLMAKGMTERTQPLVTELEEQGFTVTTYPGMPSFVTVLPKRVIVELGQHGDVSAMYLIGAEEQLELNSAVPNSFAPTVWARGYNGAGITVTILERGNVDRYNSFLNHAPASLVATDGVTNHATLVASTAASFDNTYKGMAPSATILSAGTDGTDTGAVFALRWATIEQGAPIVNYSGGFGYGSNEVEWIDRAFDYWARYNTNLVVKAASNTGDYITSPGRGWNVLTVGGYNDYNNTDWSDDEMRNTSAYINPESTHGDREKPEVVAVGGSVRGRAMNDNVITGWGTSLAAPQVSGLGALLIHRDPMLEFWPEASRAIIMASATHNITGTSSIKWYDPDDQRDGAGAINADLADEIAQSFATPLETCYSSCWWPYSIQNKYFTSLERTFYASSGNMVRVAVAWWSHADTPGNDYSFDRLDTDLDLFIQRPDGTYPDISISHDNNYEMVEFMAPQSGLYHIRVDKVQSNEDLNKMGIALAIFPAPYRVNLPLVVRD